MPKVVLKVGDDISTDAIYPGRFMATVLPSETPQHCFADYTEFNEQANRKEFPEGAIILGGRNFGCGSSREQAASCIKGHGLTVVARGIARIFLQNAINLGLNTIIAPDVDGNEGDEMAVENGKLINKTTGKSYEISAHAPVRQAIIDAGGLIPYARRKLLEEHGKQA